MEMRRGPWTVEEDLMLMNYVANHGEGRWNSLARCAGNLFTQNRLLYTDQKNVRIHDTRNMKMLMKVSERSRLTVLWVWIGSFILFLGRFHVLGVMYCTIYLYTYTTIYVRMMGYLRVYTYCYATNSLFLGFRCTPGHLYPFVFVSHTKTPTSKSNPTFNFLGDYDERIAHVYFISTTWEKENLIIK